MSFSDRKASGVPEPKQAAAKPMPTETRLLKSKMFWVGILYFAEGFPLGLFYDVFPVHFRRQGVDLPDIGLISLLGLAWTLKFIWAPAVDHYRHHRRWIIGANLGMGGVMLLLAAYSGFGPWVWAAIGLFTLLSATNDIATDGYTIEMLDKRELGLGNGLRIGFYRVGMLAAGVMLILSDHWGWEGTYLAAAFLLGAAALLVSMAPPERVTAKVSQLSLRAELLTIVRHPAAMLAVAMFLLGSLWLADRAAGWSEDYPQFWLYGVLAALVPVGGSLVRYLTRPTASEDATLSQGPMFGALLGMLRRPNMVPVILFILLFKLGDSAMGFMVKPFWVDSGFSNSQIGLVSVNLGLILSVIGGITGGWLTDRLGVFRALWLLGLFQALSNLGYAFAAMVIPQGSIESAIPLEHLALMYGASGMESFTGGLGTAAFLAFLMAIVDKKHSATEYALLSSVFALSRSVAGWAGGFGAEAMGYGQYFFLTFLLAFPAYLLLPQVRGMLSRRS